MTRNTFCKTFICPTHAVSNLIIQTSTAQGRPGSKFMVPISSAQTTSYLTFIDTITVGLSVTIFAICDVKFWWPWSMSVQGHPESSYIGPIESPLMVSYLTTFESNIVWCICLHIWGIWWKFLWPRSRTIRGYPRSKFMLLIDSPRIIFYSTSVGFIIVSVTIFEIMWRVILMTLNYMTVYSRFWCWN